MFRPQGDELDLSAIGSAGVRVRVSSWRGGTLLAGDVPLLAGSLLERKGQKVPDALELVVPAVGPDGRDYRPGTDPFAPLAAFGQRVFVTYDLIRADGTASPVPLGWFILDEWDDEDDGVVSVSALGVLSDVDRAKLTAPTSPPAGSTFASELRRLCGSFVALDLDVAPADRSVPSSMAWQKERLDAVLELVKAWPADVDVSPAGELVVRGELTAASPADVVLRESRGTIVRRRYSGSRADLDNVVVARGEATSDPNQAPVTGYAADTDETSPTFVGGPFGESVREFSSPLLTTSSAANAAAASILRGSLRPSRTIPVETVPDPRVGVNTRADLELDDGTVLACLVVESRLPLTADGGPQLLSLEVLA